MSKCVPFNLFFRCMKLSWGKSFDIKVS
jgi:hypothetical protein